MLVSDLQAGGPLLLLERQLFILSNRQVIGTGENLGVIDLDGADPATRDLGPSFGASGHLHFDPIRRTLYWATGLSRLYGNIAAYGLDGSERPEVLFNGQDVYGDSAMDDEYFYWLSSNAVRRLKKWP